MGAFRHGKWKFLFNVCCLGYYDPNSYLSSPTVRIELIVRYGLGMIDSHLVFASIKSRAYSSSSTWVVRVNFRGCEPMERVSVG